MKSIKYTTRHDSGFSVPTSPEQDLWVHVLIQAKNDVFASSGPAFYQEKAMLWFLGNSQNYRNVCDYAGINSNLLREAVLKRLLLLSLIIKGKINIDKGLKEQVLIKRYCLLNKNILNKIMKNYQGENLSDRIEELTTQDVYAICAATDTVRKGREVHKKNTYNIS
jgi:hypothetical protein